jgi:hypothetical protein
MKCLRVVAISLLCISLVLSLGCAKGNSTAGATPSPTPTPSPTSSASPTLTSTMTPTTTLGPEGCEPDRDAIQAAINAYHAENGDWPTTTTFGDPGNIKWSKLVPDYLPYIPHTDARCDWQVNTDPEGEVCLWEKC